MDNSLIQELQNEKIGRPVAIQANDILQAAITVLVGLLVFLTLGYRLNIIEWTFIRPKSPNETKSQLKR